MAFSVMIYHYTILFNHVSMPKPIYNFIYRSGIYAVSTFYILSGISLAVVYFNRELDKEFLYEFSLKRIFRIAPLFYLATTCTVILTPISDLQTILLNYSLLFGWLAHSSYIATGAWSIGNELVFYSLFPIIFFMAKKNVKLFSIFVAISIVLALYFSFSILDPSMKLQGQQWVTYINPLNQLYLFVGGVIIGYLQSCSLRINKKVLFFLSIVSIIIYTLLPISGNDLINIVTGKERIIFSILIFTICFSATFWGEIKTEWIGKPLKFLGETSYSIYLLHPIVYIFLSRRLEIGRVEIILISIFCTIILSFLSYKYLEKPFMRKGKKLAGKQSKRTSKQYSEIV